VAPDSCKTLRMMQRTIPAILLTLLLAACGQSRDRETTLTGAAGGGDATNDTASATHPGSPGGTALVPEVASGTTVLVVLEDNSLALPGQTIPPGPAVLNIENRGSDIHNLFIEGEGINRAAGDGIDAGKSASVDVMFKPGTYTFYCPFPGHRQNGEQATITIAAP
jgi:uncharacterized cupredoxin-like copper-binding protein